MKPKLIIIQNANTYSITDFREIVQKISSSLPEPDSIPEHTLDSFVLEHKK
jgi:hypothetical protein